MRVAFRIIELALLQKPPERRQPQGPKAKAYRYQKPQNLHQRNRSALSDTVRDELDIASAAISGVASPATAKGTAITL